MSAAKSLQLPAERDILIAEAEAAVARTDWPASLQYWQLVLSRFPDCVEAYIGAATVLCALGRYDEADAVTAPGYPRFAASMDFLAARAWAANGQGAVAEARSRWAELRNRFPASSIGWLGAIDMWRRKGRLPRSIRTRPISSSSCCTCRLSGGWAMCRISAARVKFPSRATATK